MDVIKGTILKGGLVKLETDRVSQPNHMSADRLIKMFHESLGGDTSIERKKTHAHIQENEHLTEGH
jgi:hypothetical protein